ncbi:tRNA-splicing endonuclease subunit Sen34 [Passer domesticus]|uniref:tRNA-splicing endonuclease subunit Sen34 n=1 Tax=Passer domesticus TaxID=48849 RepID=UPI0030FF0B26
MAAGPAGVPGVCGDGERSETPGTPPGSPPERPRVRRQRGRFLVWAPRAARALRERHRVWGALVGAPPRRGRCRPAGPRLPLQLTPEEARALRESGGATEEPVGGAEAEREEPPAGWGRGQSRAGHAPSWPRPLRRAALPGVPRALGAGACT